MNEIRESDLVDLLVAAIRHFGCAWIPFPARCLVKVFCILAEIQSSKIGYSDCSLFDADDL